MKLIVTPLILTTVFVLTGLRLPDPDEVRLEGVIRPQQIVELRSKVDGLLATVAVERGDRVSKGQVLARLAFDVETADLAIAKARTEFSADLKLAQAELDHARNELDRNRKLIARGVITQNELDVIIRDHRVAEVRVLQEEEKVRLDALEYKRALARHAQREMKAPVGGVVIEKAHTAGEMVTRTGDEPILRIAQLHPLAIDVRAPIDLLGRIKAGQTALVHCPQFDGAPRPATVKIVDQLADAASETFGIRIELPNPDYSLTAGLRCHVSFPGR